MALLLAVKKCALTVWSWVCLRFTGQCRTTFATTGGRETIPYTDKQGRDVDHQGVIYLKFELCFTPKIYDWPDNEDCSTWEHKLSCSFMYALLMRQKFSPKRGRMCRFSLLSLDWCPKRLHISVLRYLQHCEVFPPSNGSMCCDKDNGWLGIWVAGILSRVHTPRLKAKPATPSVGLLETCCPTSLNRVAEQGIIGWACSNERVQARSHHSHVAGQLVALL